MTKWTAHTFQHINERFIIHVLINYFTQCAQNFEGSIEVLSPAPNLIKLQPRLQAGTGSKHLLCANQVTSHLAYKDG